MRKTLLHLQVSALACFVALAPACEGERGAAGPGSAQEAGPFSDVPQPGPGVAAAIAKERERLRRVPGREGILAEERRYSLFDEELIIRDFFRDRRDGFFVDVGCAWPVRSNNTYYLEKHLGWKGIGIDALAEYGPGWARKRPSSRFFSYLVTDRSGLTQTFFKAANPGLSSTDRRLASGGGFGDAAEPEAVEIETITLTDLLDREGVERIALLAMDIEGHEPEALAGFDIDRFQPALVVIEGQVVPESEARVRRYFERHGYELLEKYRPFDAVNRYFARREDG